MPTLPHAWFSARNALLALSLLAAAGCSQRPPASACGPVAYQLSDPAEPANRAVFAFNRSVDDYLLAPIARGYSALPDFTQQGVHNFVANFGEPKVFLNDLLQGNGERALTSLARFTFNTTLGVAGLVDVSGKMGLARHTSDFGQTFGVWNIADGPIVELPLLGTHNLRDATGRVLGIAVAPFGDNSDTVDTLGNAATAGGLVDGRADVLPLTDRLRTQPDYYQAVRDYTAQQRAERVAEGKADHPARCQGCQPMRDAQPPVVLFRRLESNARQQLLHELEARVSEDGRDLIISRYRERSGEAAAQQRHEVHRRVPIATLLKWMAREGAEGEPC